MISAEFLVSILLVAVASAALPAPALRQYPNKPPVGPTASLSPNRPPPPPPGKVIAILRSVSDIAPDGSSYQYGYDTENGISAEESGTLIAGLPDPALAARGFFQFTSPEGLPVHISYVADENGFQPSGDVLPTAQPIPLAIVKSLEYIAAHPQPSISSAPVNKFY